MRGNRTKTIIRQISKRSIPACAGEPAWQLGRGVLPSVYPRVCGGTSHGRSKVYGTPGLSPRVRGNRRYPHEARRPLRSIPACAGEPSRTAAESSASWVYPRVCGGTPCISGSSASPSGLSPRVRGNRSPCWLAGFSDGSIPACAGEPLGLRPRTTTLRVYPRVCGGTREDRQIEPPEPGLSPRVRGNRREHRDRDNTFGSIPACAGEPPPCCPPGCPPGVYPRVCGGTIAEEGVNEQAKGLSPRVRGNRVKEGSTTECRWSIPACAGEPRPAVSVALRDGVYPRVCGGTPRP